MDIKQEFEKFLGDDWEKYVNNINSRLGFNNFDYMSINNPQNLVRSFVWLLSPERYDYWNDLHNKWQDHYKELLEKSTEHEQKLIVSSDGSLSINQVEPMSPMKHLLYEYRFLDEDQMEEALNAEEYSITEIKTLYKLIKVLQSL